MMKLIAPSILNCDFTNLTQQVRYIEIGGADWVHCDIMDGHFVPNITFGPPIVNAVRKCTKLPLDVHLMIEQPDKYIQSFAEAGADIINVHYEAVTHLHRTIQYIKDLGKKAGVTINPSTPVTQLKEVLEYVDLVLLMSVNPGFGGQTFIEATLRRITELSEIRNSNGFNFVIEVDGGINIKNISSISDAGCDVFVIGTHIFKSENISAATAEFKNLINIKST